ncbi:hypothetical protein [Micromonospora sp. NPDC047730]
MQQQRPLSLVESLFIGPETLTVPSVVSRMKYKKQRGSSDTITTADVFN